MRQRGAGQVERDVEIDAESVLPVVVAEFVDAAANQHARGVDQAIDLAELVDRVRDQFVAVFRLGELARPGRNTVRHVRDFLEAAFVAAGGHDVPAGVGKLDGCCSTDSRAGTGNERDTHSEPLETGKVRL